MAEPTTLTTPRISAPLRLASRMAAMVSAVSPGLRQGQDRRVVVHLQLAVAEFRGHFHFDVQFATGLSKI